MKLSKEERQRVETLTEYYRKWNYSDMEKDHMKFFIDCVEKLCRPKPERFTYEWRDCEHCDGVGEVGALVSMANDVCDIATCKPCGGLGKVRTKVKRTAHSV